MKGPLLAIALAAALAGCGHEIGDSCTISSDCDPNGQRVCDVSQKEGYCTIMGCDYSTCPDEAVCVRFFSGSFADRPCDVDTDCSLDELCALSNQEDGRGRCVPRSAESRYCMKACDSDGDCRDGYECRDIELMREHGGQPVLEPGATLDDSAPNFCAIAP